MRKWTLIVLAAVLITAGVAWAGPPIPLHQLEGSGGVVLTEMAYLVNPPEGEEPFGMPAFSFGTLIAKNKHINILTVSEALFHRLELSYSFHRFNLGDWETDTGLGISHSNIIMHVLNARFLMFEEGEYDQAWLPAITAGVHYKDNARIDRMDSNLGGALTGLGMRDDSGEDFTLTATKKIERLLPRPLFVSGTVRNTDAIHTGYLGFSHDREFVLEANVAYLLQDNLIVGAEFRQKPDKINHISGVVGDEDDWWSLAACYIVNEDLTVTVAYANLGTMLNHEEPWSFWLQVKYEMP